MAGYTSRLFLSLSIPFFGLVLWFMKKKSQSKSALSKAIQVEDTAPESPFEEPILKLNLMKLKNQEDSSDESQNFAMQLKEAQTATRPAPDENGLHENGPAKAKKKQSKSKMREKSHTCLTDYIVNGKDRDHLQDDNDDEDLAIGIESIDLNTSVLSKGEFLLNARNTSHSDMDSAGHDSNLDSNSSLSSTDGDNARTPDNDSPSTQQDGGTTAKECDKDTHDERNSECDDKKSEPCLQTASSIGSHESLNLPAEGSENQEMLGSPGATYCDSVGSADSGRGGSEIHFESYPPSQENNLLNYAFEIPQDYVGRLIGKKGKTVNSIKAETNAEILIKRHPTCNHNKICLVTGTEDEINAALRLIRKKFPPEYYPSVTLSQICFLPFMPCPENLMLRLPEGSSFDVMLSATVSAGHFFLQQPTHPTFHSLLGLTYQMAELYSRDASAPSLPHLERGYICAANLGNCWYRAEIDDVFYESDECRVKFLDYGGYSVLPRSALKQINYHFMNVPFQATECYLGLVTLPEGQTEWSSAATASFEELAQGQILQGFIVAYAENGVPFVQLYRVTGANMIDINRELVRRGHARSIELHPAV